MPVYKKVNKDFFKKWTPKMAYVLGFFAADGYITVNKRGGQFWCFQINDHNLLKNIKKAIQSNHRIGIRLRAKPNEKTSYRLQVGSNEMCDDLRKLGFLENKSKSLVIPNVPQSYFSDFVRGYFDGDGNIWMGKIHTNRKTQHIVLQLVFTSCSIKFLKQLQTRLSLFGLIGGCIYTSKKRKFFRLQYSVSNALKLYNLMYNDNTKDFSGLFLNRKKKVFEKFRNLRL